MSVDMGWRRLLASGPNYTILRILRAKGEAGRLSGDRAVCDGQPWSGSAISLKISIALKLAISDIIAQRPPVSRLPGDSATRV